MAKVHQPAFAQNPKTFTAVVTSAISNLDSDTPVGVQELVTAGPEGCIVTSLTAMPRATVTAMALHIFISKDDGATLRLVNSARLDAHTSSATTAMPVVDFEFTETEPMRLEAGDQLYVGAGVAAAGGIVFAATTTDF